MLRQALARIEKHRAALGKGLIFAWGAAALVGLASLSVGHMAAMPEPGKEERMAREALALRSDPGRDFRLHVIYEKCSCTERLFTHLLRRRAHAEVEEMVLFVGGGAEKRRAAEEAGFRFATLDVAGLESRFGLQAAPVLLAFDRSGAMQYAGGYFDHPSAVKPLDLRIHAELARNARPDPLPVFGCAVSTALQERLDPLGVVSAVR